MNNIIKVLKTLSEPHRIEMVRYVMKNRETKCENLLKVFKLPQPTMSRHLTKLVDAGILSLRKEGTSNFYSIQTANLKKIGLDIQKIIQNN